MQSRILLQVSLIYRSTFLTFLQTSKLLDLSVRVGGFNFGGLIIEGQDLEEVDSGDEEKLTDDCSTTELSIV